MPMTDLRLQEIQIAVERLAKLLQKDPERCQICNLTLTTKERAEGLFCERHLIGIRDDNWHANNPPPP
jgi:hypothetical protein